MFPKNKLRYLLDRYCFEVQGFTVDRTFTPLPNRYPYPYPTDTPTSTLPIPYPNPTLPLPLPYQYLPLYPTNTYPYPTSTPYPYPIFSHRLNLPWTTTNISKPKSAKSAQPFSSFSETNEQQLIFIYNKHFPVDQIVNLNHPRILLNSHKKFHQNRSSRLGGVQ